MTGSPKSKVDGAQSSHEGLSAGRRRALARLGLAATVAYVVPTLVHLDRAIAKTKPSKHHGGGHGHGHGGDDGGEDN